MRLGRSSSGADWCGAIGGKVFGIAGRSSAASAVAIKFRKPPQKEHDMPDAYANGSEDYADSLAAVLTPAMIRLIIAARVVAYEKQDAESINELDYAVEAFSEAVPWEDEPKDNEVS